MAIDGVKMSDLADLLVTTLSNLGPPRLHHTQRLQEYEAVQRWFQEGREELEGGDKIERRIRLSETGNARHTRPLKRDQVNVDDNIHVMEAPFVYATTNYLLTKEQLLANSGGSQIVDLAQSERAGAMQDFAEELEYWAWRHPTDADDDLHPYGLQYWIPRMASGHAGVGFFGGSSLSDTDKVAGIEPATSGHNTPDIAGGQPRWRSFVAGGEDSENDHEWYTEINDNAIDTMEMCYEATRFVSPTLVRDLVQGYPANFRIYCGQLTRIEMKRYLKQRNENIGQDLGMFNGAISFNRVPIISVPALSGDAERPIYFVNHAVFTPFVRRGDYMAESEPQVPDGLHRALAVYLDLSYQFMCVNRSRVACMTRSGDKDTSTYDNWSADNPPVQLSMAA